MKTQYARVIGVDIASLKIDINDSAGKIKSSLPNTVDAISKHLIHKIGDRSATLVICEATGSYEHVLVDACHQAGIAICIANPRQVRDFAKGHGFLEKSDTIDAFMIRRFGEDVEIHLTAPRTPQQRAHQALVRRRVQVLGMLSQEQNRLGQTQDCLALELIQEAITQLKDQLKRIDGPLSQMLKKRAEEDPNVDKKRQARGGRSQVRNVLYMATLVATRHNSLIREFYLRLLRRGKLKKVALVAAMRKLLTILNNMVRCGQMWQKANKEAIAAPSLN